MLGSAALAVPDRSWTFVLCWTALVALAVGVLVALAQPSTHRRDERLVSALAILGRALVILLLLHLALVQQASSCCAPPRLLAAVSTALALSALHRPATGAPGRVVALPAAERARR